MTYKLTARAVMDLELLAETGREHAGARATRLRLARLFDTFAMLDEYPFVGPAVEPELQAGVRKYVVDERVIYYRLLDETAARENRVVLVLRVVPGRMQVPREFGG